MDKTDIIDALVFLFPNDACTVDDDLSFTCPDETMTLEKLSVALSQKKASLFVEEVRNYVGERILAHASQGTQMNMAAAAAAGILTPEQMQAFQEGLMWVAATRAKGKEVIQNEIFDFKNADWPEPTAGAVALAEAF